MNSTGYKALREQAAWGDFNGRGKIKLTGKDRARLLHAMTTNHIRQLTPGSGVYAFFLNVQGRILGDANIFCMPDYFLLDTEPETAEKLYQHLKKFIIADDVTPEDLTPTLSTIAVEGPKSREVLLSVGAPVPEADLAIALWETCSVARASLTGEPGFLLFLPIEAKSDLIQRLESAGAVAADAEAFRIVRLEHGKPRYGHDITERNLAQETQQMQAVHFQKGCYLGQEIVERVRSRGHVNRVLMPLHLETTEPPQPGTKLTVDNQPAAEISSSVYSPALDKVVGLGYVRVEFAKPGTRLAWDSVPAEVQTMEIHAPAG
ncbi:MAG TPA: glycine cleavage T C-terminal barrel domain-containing protein [Bryobacteraceae bacterium]|nr:glycine cleavage T C-terminal barrel domain-containing protein [Bryobacteraceae bacterium]